MFRFKYDLMKTEDPKTFISDLSDLFTILAYVLMDNFCLIKNLSSSTYHKKYSVFRSLRHHVFPSFRLSLLEFKKNLPNTFIYESILMKIYANTNIIKYDLKGHWRSKKVICLSGNIRQFFITHSFMNWFWQKFIWKLLLWIQKYFILIIMTSKVIEGHKTSSVFLGI